VSKPPTRCSRPLSKCPGRCRSVEAAVEVWRLEVWKLLLRFEAAVEVFEAVVEA
jgi:hypothetical protein